MMRFKKLELANFIQHSDDDLDITFKPIGMMTEDYIITLFIQRDSVNMHMENESKAYDEIMFLTDEEELYVLKCFLMFLARKEIEII